MRLPKRVKLGKNDFNGDFLRSVTEKKALQVFAHLDKNQVINAWKQANGHKPTHAAVIEAKSEKKKASTVAKDKKE